MPVMVVRPTTVSGPTEELSDDFNRSDRHLTVDGYVQVTDGLTSSQEMSIEGNEVHRGANSTGNDGTDVYLHPTSLSGTRQYAQATVLAIDQSAAAVVLRCTGETQDSDTAVWGWVDSGNWGIGVGTIGDGTDDLSLLNDATGTGSFANGSVLRLECDGDVATLFVDGVQQGQLTGTTLPTGVRCGINCSDFDADTAIDDFSAGTL